MPAASLEPVPGHYCPAADPDITYVCPSLLLIVLLSNLLQAFIDCDALAFLLLKQHQPCMKQHDELGSMLTPASAMQACES